MINKKIKPDEDLFLQNTGSYKNLTYCYEKVGCAWEIMKEAPDSAKSRFTIIAGRIVGMTAKYTIEQNHCLEVEI